MAISILASSGELAPRGSGVGGSYVAFASILQVPLGLKVFVAGEQRGRGWVVAHGDRVVELGVFYFGEGAQEAQLFSDGHGA